MSNRSLKSLDWEALFKKSSDEEYDSDETTCGEGEGVNNISVMKSLEPGISEIQTKVESGLHVLSNENVLQHTTSTSSYEYYNNLKEIEGNLNDENANGLSGSFVNTLSYFDSGNNMRFVNETTLGMADISLDFIEKTAHEFEMMVEAEHCPEGMECLFDLGSPEMKWRLMNKQQVSDSSEQISSNQSPVIHSDEDNPDQIRMELDPQKMSLEAHIKQSSPPKNLENVDEHQNNYRYITNCLPHMYNGTQINTDDGPLQTENVFLQIPTDNFTNILEIDEYVEHMDVTNVNLSSPPRTLIKTFDKRYIASKKLSFKRNKHIKKCFDQKILPARKCQSKYIDKSQRCNNLEELPKSGTDSNNSNVLKTEVGKSTEDIQFLRNKTDDHTVVVKARRIIESKIPKGEKPKSQVCAAKRASLEEMKQGSVLQTLHKMEQTLHETEVFTYMWINGKGEHISREKAFEILMETQGIGKMLETFKVPKRSSAKITAIKNILLEKAKKLALAIDAAIAESDQMFRQECLQIENSSRFNENSIERRDLRADTTLDPNQGSINGLRGIFFNNKDRDSISCNNQRKIGRDNNNSKNNVDSTGCLFIQMISPDMGKDNLTIDNLKQEKIKNNLKPILKNSCHESILGSSVSNGKHISFSDDIDLCILSGVTSSSLSSSQASPQNTTEIDRNDTDTHAFGNTNPRLAHKQYFVSGNNINEPDNNKTSVQFKIEISKPNTLYNTYENKDQEVQVPVALNVRSEESICSTVQSSPTSNNLIHFNSCVTQLQQIDSSDVSVNEQKNNSEVYVEKHTPTSLSEGFGFTEEFDSTNKIWGHVCLADIKYLRVKSPGEFVPANEDYDSFDFEEIAKWGEA